MSNGRGAVWREQMVRNGRALGADDMLANLGAEQLEEVNTRPHRGGIESTHSCRHCGWQAKMITPWGEILAFFIGRKVKGTTPTNQGIVVRPVCGHCGKITPILIEWPEIKKWVESGVQAGRIPRNALAGR